MTNYQHRHELEPIATGLRRALDATDLASCLANTMPSRLPIDPHQLGVARDLLGRICEAIESNDRDLWRKLEAAHAALYPADAGIIPPPTRAPEIEPPGPFGAQRPSPWLAPAPHPSTDSSGPQALEPTEELGSTRAATRGKGAALPFHPGALGPSKPTRSASDLEPHPSMGATAPIAGRRADPLPWRASDASVSARGLTLEAYAAASARLIAGVEATEVHQALGVDADEWQRIEAAFEECFAATPALRARYWQLVESHKSPRPVEGGDG